MNYQETKQRLEWHQGIGLALVVAWCGQIVACMALGLWTVVGAGIVGLAFSMAKVCAISFELHKEDNHGLDRRADPQVHGDTSDGADDGTGTYTIDAGDGTTITVSFTAGYAVRKSQPEPRTVERTGIRLGEVEGYRCWKLHGPLLTSMNGMAWVPGKPAEGNGLDENNECGVHAFKSEQCAVRYAHGYHEGSDDVFVVGRVKLWGEIVEHEDGYRGQFAKPVEILRVIGAYTPALWVHDAPGPDDIVAAIISAINGLYGLEPYQEPTAEAA